MSSSSRNLFRMAPFVRHACPPRTWWHGSLSILGALLSGMALPLTLKVNGEGRDGGQVLPLLTSHPFIHVLHFQSLTQHVREDLLT